MLRNLGLSHLKLVYFSHFHNEQSYNSIMSFSTKCQTIKRQTILVFIPQTKISQTEIIRSRLAIYKKTLNLQAKL